MKSNQYQIRLTDEMRKQAQGRADELGLTLAGYIKYLIAQDIRKVLGKPHGVSGN